VTTLEEGRKKKKSNPTPLPLETTFEKSLPPLKNIPSLALSKCKEK
jgi:hypothetical protein